MDTNGLVRGRIPAGNPCPFLAECQWKVEGCPTPSNLKPGPYSCAAARMHSTVKVRPSPLLRDVLDNPTR